MEPKYTYEQLVEKIVRAKVKLETRKGKRVGHGDRCMIEMDPDYYGPCTCGATKVNNASSELFDDIIEDLKL